MKTLRKLILTFALGVSTISCNDFIDVVPDNIATIDYAFRLRNSAEQYLFTCYSFVPHINDLANGFISVRDEIWWPIYPNSSASWEIAHGSQNTNTPYMDYWNGIKPLWRGIRECNIFLENIDKVPDIKADEKQQWIAEVKFLKAYYHFFLLSMYGPIPIVKENIPISASPDEVRVVRRPVDEVFDYVVQLLDEAVPALEDERLNSNSELGRITRPIALSLKAKVLVFAASPLFNGNTDYSAFTNQDGTLLFNQTYSKEKWQKAAAACKEAIEAAHATGHTLYYFTETSQAKDLSLATKNQMNIRNMFTERWNKEVIWANTNARSTNLQTYSTPRGLDPAAAGNSAPGGQLGVPFNITDLFYSKNGVPIEEDLTWNYSGRYNLKVATSADKYNLKEGYTTAEYHFDREDRFYASLAFDGGIWYGQGRFNDNNPFWMEMKFGQEHGKDGPWLHTSTGYFPKKYVHYSNVLSVSGGIYTIQDYPWTMMRLGDLYLLYAEALNEAQGPGPEVFEYLDLIRKRAGLKGVVESWTAFSRNSNKVTTQEGVRDIIQRERNIELALEGHRNFDVRRWKMALSEYNKPITGWDVDQSLAQSFYRERTLFRPTFSLKDYFWPIKEQDLIVNKNLVQNPGW